MTTQADRARARFSLLDADRNGVLEEADFTALAARIVAELGEDAGSAAARAVHAGHLAFWEGLRQAGSGGDAVTFEEYARAVASPEWFDAHGMPYAESVADICDRDRDGRISPEEFTKAMTAIGFAAAAVAELFAAFDRDGNGYLDRDEWVAGIRGFYVGEGAQTTDVLVAG